MKERRKEGLRSRQERIANEILMHFRANKKRGCEISLNEPIDTDKDGNALTLVDIICCEDHAIEQVDRNDQFSQVGKYLISQLDSREREILILRYGLDGSEPLTQREIAQQHGISRSYVSRIEKKAIEKLRACCHEG